MYRASIKRGLQTYLSAMYDFAEKTWMHEVEYSICYIWLAHEFAQGKLHIIKSLLHLISQSATVVSSQIQIRCDCKTAWALAACPRIQWYGRCNSPLLVALLPVSCTEQIIYSSSEVVNLKELEYAYVRLCNRRCFVHNWHLVRWQCFIFNISMKLYGFLKFNI
jgi:hypothetical protein